MGVAAPRGDCDGVPVEDRSACAVCAACDGRGWGFGATRATEIGGIAGAVTTGGFGDSLGGAGDGLRDSGFSKVAEGAGETEGDGGGLGTAVAGATPRSVAMATGGGVIDPVCVMVI
jgi:hypothetical protein